MVQKSDNELAYAIRNLVTQMQRRLRKQISDLNQLSVAEQGTMAALLVQKEMSPTEIRLQLNISSQFMAQVLNKLSGLAYIQRQSSATDGRKIVVSLTKTGKQFIQHSRQERESWLAEKITTLYSAQEKKQIDEVVALLMKLIEL